MHGGAGADSTLVATAATETATETATVRIGLAGADPNGLESYALAVSDPNNTRYRQFLSPAEVRKRFGPTPAQVRKVHRWISDSELRITAENSHWIDVSGTPDQVAKAFAAGIARRRVPGTTMASAAAATVPSELAGAVSSVAGLGRRHHGVRLFSHRVGPTRGLRG
ncbi:protease pro-enzyme activation domain-containing protein [Catenulispora yoronensis]